MTMVSFLAAENPPFATCKALFLEVVDPANPPNLADLLLRQNSRATRLG
jgi:hypothetical protein